MERETQPGIALPIAAALIGLIGIVGAVTYYGSQRMGEPVINLEAKSQAPAPLVEEEGATTTASSSPLVASVESFDNAAYLEARALGKVVLLYFSAPWCPECDFGRERLAEALRVQPPDKVAAFLVDLDGATEEELNLLSSLEVSAPETKIIFRGNKIILRSTELWTADRFAAELAAALAN